MEGRRTYDRGLSDFVGELSTQRSHAGQRPAPGEEQGGDLSAPVRGPSRRRM